TLARCFVGGDENSAMEMGKFIEGVGNLQSKTGATVMVLHHAGKRDDRERGSSSLRAAADVMIQVSKDNNVVTVKNDKQKDEEEFDPIRLRLQAIQVGESDEDITSCVLVPYGGSDRAENSALPGHLRRALAALESCESGTATSNAWLKALGTA